MTRFIRSCQSKFPEFRSVSTPVTLSKLYHFCWWYAPTWITAVRGHIPTTGHSNQCILGEHSTQTTAEQDELITVVKNGGRLGSPVCRLVYMIGFCLYSPWRSAALWASLDELYSEVGIRDFQEVRLFYSGLFVRYFAPFYFGVKYFGGKFILVSIAWKLWKLSSQHRRLIFAII